MRGPPLPTCPEMLWLSPALVTGRSTLDSMFPFLAVALSFINPDHMQPLFRERMGQNRHVDPEKRRAHQRSHQVAIALVVGVSH